MLQQEKEVKEEVKESVEPDNSHLTLANGEVQELAQKTFSDLGVCQEIVEATQKMGYKAPSKIQAESLPFTLKGKDVIALAETGSGKTAAFAIPVIQKILENPQPFFACVMSPTRELCLQISTQFEALGATVGLKCATLVGGLDMV